MKCRNIQAELDLCGLSKSTNKQYRKSTTAFVLGYYCPGQNKVLACPEGTYNNAFNAVDISNCTTCYSGEFSYKGSSQCYSCDDSYYITSASSGCTTNCSSILNSARTSCAPCPSGTTFNREFSNNPSIGCAKCEVNQYSKEGASSCTACPTNTSNNATGSTYCFGECGNGNKSASDECDDGNIDNGDGCSDACKIEAGFNCTTEVRSVCKPVCGDAKKVLGPEGCDDGNNAAKDGCSNDCKVENGWYCKGGTISSQDKCFTVCGDEIRVESQGEECDDGNIVNGDGCSKLCKVEDGFNCTNYDHESADDCNDICGDGKVFDPSNDFCDDNNTIDGDGCSHDCFVERGWICTGGNATSKDSCKTVCGDGILVTGTEECDDGNIFNKDGCNSNCKIEPNCYCNMNPDSTGSKIHPDSICNEVCGDGKNLGLRKCDDGGLENGDGCNSNCEVERGYNCTGGSPLLADKCIEICGDGLDFEKHECDDGDKEDGDGCSSTCEIEQCFECKGGTIDSPDKCIPLNITSKLKKTSVPNEYDVVFSIDKIEF